MCPSLSGVFVICYRVLFVGCMLGTPGPWGGVCVCLYFGVLVSSLCNGMQLSCIFEEKEKESLYKFTIGRNFSGNQHGTVISVEENKCERFDLQGFSLYQCYR